MCRRCLPPGTTGCLRQHRRTSCPRPLSQHGPRHRIPRRRCRPRRSPVSCRSPCRSSRRRSRSSRLRRCPCWSTCRSGRSRRRQPYRRHRRRRPRCHLYRRCQCPATLMSRTGPSHRCQLCHRRRRPCPPRRMFRRHRSQRRPLRPFRRFRRLSRGRLCIRRYRHRCPVRRRSCRRRCHLALQSRRWSLLWSIVLLRRRPRSRLRHRQSPAPGRLSWKSRCLSASRILRRHCRSTTSMRELR